MIEKIQPLFGKEAYGSPIGSEPRLKEEPTAHKGIGEILWIIFSFHSFS
jgi:hypothetical protein